MLIGLWVTLHIMLSAQSATVDKLIHSGKSLQLYSLQFKSSLSYTQAILINACP